MYIYIYMCVISVLVNMLFINYETSENVIFIMVVNTNNSSYKVYMNDV